MLGGDKMDKNNIFYWEDIVNNPSKLYKKWFKEERKFLIKNIRKNSS